MTTPNATTPATIQILTQKADFTAEMQALLDGINSELPGVDPFLFNDRTIPRAEVVGALTAVVTAVAATRAARLEVAAKLAAEREVIAAAKPYRKGMKEFLVGRYGANSTKLQRFGFAQHRTPRKKAVNKAKGVEKASATRKARGTKGCQQRAAVAPSATPAPALTPAPAPAPTPRS